MTLASGKATRVLYPMPPATVAGLLPASGGDPDGPDGWRCRYCPGLGIDAAPPPLRLP